MRMGPKSSDSLRFVCCRNHLFSVARQSLKGASEALIFSEKGQKMINDSLHLMTWLTFFVPNQGKKWVGPGLELKRPVSKFGFQSKKSQVLFSIDCQGQVPDLRSVAYRNLSLTKAAP